MLGTILVVLLILWLLGYIGYGRSRWGWGRNGDVGTIILVVLILVLLFGPWRVV